MSAFHSIKFFLPIALFQTLLLASGIFGLWQPVSAQPSDMTLYAFGTTAEDSDNRDWAYVTWLADDTTLLLDLPLAVYAKAGSASSVMDYELQGTVRTYTEVAVIDALLSRSESLGQDLTALGDSVSGLYTQASPDLALLSTAEMLSALIQASATDPGLFEVLVMMGRAHPGVALCLGTAWADLMPGSGTYTYELRRCPLPDPTDASDCDQVVGRVTIIAGEPAVLAAPNAPIELPNMSHLPDRVADPLSTEGDLNVKLRWAVDEDLRRQVILLYGFNLYRVEVDYAQQNGFDTSPPPAGTLQLLADSVDAVAKINRLPLLPFRFYTQAEAQDFSDLTYFVIDDNERFEGGTGFSDGEEVYYFVAGQDVLGRDGEYSEGTLVTFCDRIPPLPPFEVDVANDYEYDSATDTPDQRLEVSWLHDPESGAEAYYLFRWTSLKELEDAANLPNPAARAIAGPIPATAPGRLSYRDDGAGAPFVNSADPGNGDDTGKQFWYTVRGVESSSCGDNFSTDSAPAGEFLRDRVGPGAPTGSVDIVFDRPEVVSKQVSRRRLALDEDGAKTQYIEFICNRPPGDQGLLLAEFAYTTDQLQLRGQIIPLGTVWFEPGVNQVRLTGQIDSTQITSFEQEFVFCSVTSIDNVVSAVASTTINPSAVEPVAIAEFDAFINSVTVPSGSTPPGGGHQPDTPTGERNPICVNFTPTDTANEYRVYRQVDGGEDVLIEQGILENDTDPVTVKDFGYPNHVDEVCYLIQLIDADGNPSELITVGCTGIETPPSQLPDTFLSPPEPTGTAEAQTLRLEWMCPPPGVAFFEVAIGLRGGIPPAEYGEVPESTIAGDLFFVPPPDDIVLPDYAGPPPNLRRYPGLPVTFAYSTYLTRPIGEGLVADGPVFSISDVRLIPGIEYFFAVRPIMRSGHVAPFSNQRTFFWSLDDDLTGPEAPWPYRTPILPNIDFHPLVTSEYLGPHGYETVGVRIARLRSPTLIDDDVQPAEFPVVIPFADDPVKLVFAKEDDSGQSLFACMLYRYQVVNGNFPVASGDVYQVSPLMERIAYRPDPGAPNLAVELNDPFVGYKFFQDDDTLEYVYDLYLLDTQPLLRGAEYIYLIVVFDQRMEIADIVATNPVTIP